MTSQTNPFQQMNKLTRGVLVLSLLASVALGETSKGEIIYHELQLKSGRILHQAKIKSERASAVMILCKEGLISVPKSDLPQNVADLYPSDAEAESRERARNQQRADKAATERDQAAERAARELAARRLNGLQIDSWEAKKWGVLVKITNYTDQPRTGFVSDLILRKGGVSFEGASSGAPTPDTLLLPVPGGASRMFNIRFALVSDPSDASDVTWKK